MVGRCWWNERLYSHASHTRMPGLPSSAPVGIARAPVREPPPIWSQVAPTITLGSSPQRMPTHEVIAVVVLLPCVPAIDTAVVPRCARPTPSA